MGTLLNRRRYMGGKALPYDAEVEYIEGTGTQYINTGIKPSSTLRSVLKFSIKNGFGFANSAFLFGAFDQQESYYSVALRSPTSIRVPNGTSFSNCTIPTIDFDTSHEISYKAGEVKYDGQVISSYSGRFISNPTVNIRLFGRDSFDLKNQYITPYLCIEGYEVYDGNELVLDLIPVRVGQVGYMRDKISGKLYGNSGTGSFTLGPDKT